MTSLRWLRFASRILAGAAAGNLSACQAAIADVTSGARRARKQNERARDGDRGAARRTRGHYGPAAGPGFVARKLSASIAAQTAAPAPTKKGAPFATRA